jgi:hypothetical protein
MRRTGGVLGYAYAFLEQYGYYERGGQVQGRHVGFTPLGPAEMCQMRPSAGLEDHLGTFASR